MRHSRAITRAVSAVRARPRVAVAALVGLLVAGAALGWFARCAGRDAPPDVQPIARPVAGPPERPTRVVTFAEGCTTSGCHTDVTVAAAVHAPVAQSACDTCHAPDAGGHTYPLLRPKASLCSTCHDTGGHDQFQHKSLSDQACLACHDPHKGTTRALLAASTIRETCARCHPATEGHSQHTPYADGRCGECHDPHSADNRHLLLGGQGAALCNRCHTEVVHAVETSPHAHRTLEGGCSACHAPHASDRPDLLHTQPRELCITCHADVAKAVSTAVVTHDPVLKDDQCVTCHDPHASDNPRMLRASQRQVCLSCHDKEIIATNGRKVAALAPSLATSPVVHGAITHGDCSACHSVHGGEHERLLRQINPGVLTGAYDAGNYALCFACHDKSVAETGTGTLFRDGGRNLHEVHLRAGEKSRGCASCHAVHSSDLPRLIATTVKYEGSEWAMPMKFVITPAGGSCAPGCHEPMAYSRESGGTNTPHNGGGP